MDVEAKVKEIIMDKLGVEDSQIPQKLLLLMI
jgi:hypothetical protein